MGGRRGTTPRLLPDYTGLKTRIPWVSLRFVFQQPFHRFQPSFQLRVLNLQFLDPGFRLLPSAFHFFIQSLDRRQGYAFLIHAGDVAVVLADVESGGEMY